MNAVRYHIDAPTQHWVDPFPNLSNHRDDRLDDGDMATAHIGHRREYVGSVWRRLKEPVVWRLGIYSD